ncbi:PAS domain-containing hybrid sensor histidine kinase/response regulator [Methylocystis bryophila]|uniref:histidine kinase n=1 Tax=Methylocystis bryophila TaxID=655015 RepID=A0A1W6MVA3_9HYPH|nr:PAS domain S-box protein [Methylocystis bryophila]ARN81446.1 hypothetical protein B1812_10600 [Methylocystis bryophila]BDV37453.1 hypothetical protein DSM21852_07060 [Methylocystis bryophila]
MQGQGVNQLGRQLSPVGVEAEETLQAIVVGEADALVIETKNGPRVYTLKDSNDAYRLLVENMAQAALVLEAEGTVLYCNGRLPELLSRKNVIGHNFLECVAPAQRERAEGLLREGAVRPASAEFSLLAANGSSVAVQAAATPLEFNEQASVALVVSALDDIEALKVSETKLRASEERLRRVLETEAVGVLFFDREGVLIEANDVFLRMVGYERADIDAKRLDWRSFTPPDGIAEAKKQMAQYLQVGRIGPHEREYLHKDGSRRWMLFSGRDLGDGTFSQFCVDISDRKRAEAGLQEAGRRKDAFLATLAHELRNPLAAISNGLGALQRLNTEDPDDLHVMLRRQAAHLVHLVDDLLEVSRISRGKIELRKQPVDLSEMVRQAVEASGPMIESKGHELTVRLDEAPLIVEGDATRLSQVVTNLLDNAAKFTPRGGRIFIETGRAGNTATLLVRDSGVGVSPEELATIFDLFVQLDPSVRGSQGGLGIGLALSRQLVELHGGRIEARSSGLGCGSEFYVQLPLIQQISSNAPGPRVVAPRPRGDSAPTRVLIVDDDADVAESLSLLLRCLGIGTRIANNASAALAAVADSAPQLVFLDLGMPGVDGYETARRIRALPEGKSLILAALSGWGREEDKQRAAAAGFDHHFVKPIELDAIEALIAALPRVV